MWQQHLKVCAGFVLLIIPVLLADNTLLRPGSGGWPVDWRGLFINAYLTFLGIHLFMSSFAIKFFPSLGVFIIHLFSVIISVTVLYVGFILYDDVESRISAERYEAEEAAKFALRKPFINSIELKSWYYAPNADRATEIIINVVTHESGRFAVNVWGFEGDESYFIEDDYEQIQVGKDENFSFRIPLMRDTHLGKEIKTGVPKYVEITIRLFSDSTGSAGIDIMKIFKSHPTELDDGEYFYGEIPPPTNNR